mmetsp:Transcript_17636/g.50505  ORF Transcript_17636/g.50505 Transcript_17636/m.50505 type:complete len:82 (-) Transcript_17636:13-258(-)
MGKKVRVLVADAVADADADGDTSGKVARAAPSFIFHMYWVGQQTDLWREAAFAYSIEFSVLLLYLAVYRSLSRKGVGLHSD